MKLPRFFWRVYERCVVPRLAGRAVRRILRDSLGHDRTVWGGVPMDAGGKALPWFTYPAIEYIEQLDFAGKVVFEFGAGQSTRFWAERAAKVVSVEHDAGWHARVAQGLPANVELMIAAPGVSYVAALADRPEEFDVIVVDGIERRACCELAVRKLRRGGLIILDNADWHHHCAAILRGAGLLEVDMTGFGPVNGYTWTTSFFFQRDFDFPPRRDRQPWHGIGSLPHLEDA